MLPPALHSLLTQLQAKPEKQRSSNELALIRELQQLDTGERLQKAMNEEFGGGLRIFAGPAGTCQCCGAKL